MDATAGKTQKRDEPINLPGKSPGIIGMERPCRNEV